jgi:hypothetical protein
MKANRDTCVIESVVAIRFLGRLDRNANLNDVLRRESMRATPSSENVGDAINSRFQDF